MPYALCWGEHYSTVHMTNISSQQSMKLIFIDQYSDPPDVPSATHNLMFSSSMSDEDFFKWLRSKGISDKDCKTLSGRYKVPRTDYQVMNIAVTCSVLS